MKSENSNILISACLLGVSCRYDGKNGYNARAKALTERYNLIPICPEQLGGLMTPRKPSEIQQGLSDTDSVCVKNKEGKDVTDHYVRGAKEALKLAEIFNCHYAVLKERSPSCGHGMIYDGTFSGQMMPGNGITAELLEQNGIIVIGESEIDTLGEK